MASIPKGGRALGVEPHSTMSFWPCSERLRAGDALASCGRRRTRSASLGRFDVFATPLGNDRSLRTRDGKSRRKAAVADRRLGRLNWAESSRPEVASRRTGVRVIADIPLGASPPQVGINRVAGERQTAEVAACELHNVSKKQAYSIKAEMPITAWHDS